ncbi:hypothetical protein R1flu_016914 [Riccia fluitans]|uniref:Integrase catalytic domain-containing protein n=1 Tax=Riccia fluitans TaxID=41844 RepID=A0ABD1YNR2_9MARC
MDNASEFRSQSFNQYCLSVGIQSEEPVPYEHEQNGLAEAHIKLLQHVGRPLLLQSSLPASGWGHAILHAAQLLRLRLASYLQQSPQQLASGFPPSIAHLRVFGCAVYVPIPPPKQNRPVHIDPPTKQCEQEVQRLLNLNRAAESQLDAFVDGDHQAAFMPTECPKKLQIDADSNNNSYSKKASWKTDWFQEQAAEARPSAPTLTVPTTQTPPPSTSRTTPDVAPNKEVFIH